MDLFIQTLDSIAVTITFAENGSFVFVDFEDFYSSTTKSKTMNEMAMKTMS